MSFKLKLAGKPPTYGSAVQMSTDECAERVRDSCAEILSQTSLASSHANFTCACHSRLLVLSQVQQAPTQLSRFACPPRSPVPQGEGTNDCMRRQEGVQHCKSRDAQQQTRCCKCSQRIAWAVAGSAIRRLLCVVLRRRTPGTHQDICNLSDAEPTDSAPRHFVVDSCRAYGPPSACEKLCIQPQGGFRASEQGPHHAAGWQV